MTVRRSLFIWSSTLGLAAALACGGASAAREDVRAPEPMAVESEPDPGASDMAASAEIGGLDQAEAEASFRASLDGLQACVSQGLTRLGCLAGSIEFAVKVDAQRRAERVWAAQSTLGERATEKCMFEALRRVTWPKPVGGPYGIARNAFEFELRKGTQAPAVWDAGVVEEVLAEHAGALAACRDGDTSELLVTLYVGEGGKPLSGGASSSEAVDEKAIDCVVEALLAAQFPEPERAPTQVRFTL